MRLQPDDRDEFSNVNGFRRLPPLWGFQWKSFFVMPGEVLIGLLVGDPLSYLDVEPGWTPDLAEDGWFETTQLIRVANGVT